MQETKLYTLNFSQLKTYLFAGAFILGNILLPQICHLMPNGGRIWLPIYFFTLVGAYKYGWKVGLMTAVLSPVFNALLFGMPALTMLPIVLTKSMLLAVAAGFAAHRFNRFSLPILFLVVLAYQFIGSLLEWAMFGNFSLAMQDFTMGFPGMLFQMVGGYLILKLLADK